MDPIAQVQIADQLLRLSDFRAFAYQDEPRWNELLNPRKDANDVVRSFHRPEVRSMHENLLAVGSIGLAQTHVSTPRRAAGIDEVVDDSYLAPDSKLFDGALFEILRDRRHAIRLLDGELDHLLERSIGAHQRDVRSMESRDRLDAL